MKVKRIDKTLPIPQYATEGSVGLDTYAREEVIIAPNTCGLVKLNLVIQAMPGTFIGVLPRSSTFKKTGLMLANSLGVVDRDYCGSEDEVCALVYNTSTTNSVRVKREDRLFQLVIFNCETPEIEEVENDIQDYSRGGHGSTGEGQL